MRLDPASMTINHEGQVWAPQRREWTLISKMSAQPGRVWERDTLLSLTGSPTNDVRCADTWIKRIRRAFRDRGWPDPITTRHGLGYVWSLPVTLASAVHAPAAGADEFRFRKA